MDIETISLTKAYPLKTALHGVSVQLKGGNIHALVGENGAGKSTLANMLAGSLAPTSGTILLDGKEEAFTSAGDALARGIVLVRQRPLLSESLSAWENIILKTGGDSTRKGFMGGGFFLRPPSPELLRLKDFKGIVRLSAVGKTFVEIAFHCEIVSLFLICHDTYILSFTVE